MLISPCLQLSNTCPERLVKAINPRMCIECMLLSLIGNVVCSTTIARRVTRRRVVRGMRGGRIHVNCGFLGAITLSSCRAWQIHKDRAIRAMPFFYYAGRTKWSNQNFVLLSVHIYKPNFSHCPLPASTVVPEARL